MIVTNYILIQSIKSVFVSTLVFVSVIWLSQSLNSIKLIINNGANLLDFFLLSAYSLPSWLLIALPFGTFAGCMISYSNSNKQTCYFSFYNICFDIIYYITFYPTQQL